MNFPCHSIPDLSHRNHSCPYPAFLTLFQVRRNIMIYTYRANLSQAVLVIFLFSHSNHRPEPPESIIEEITHYHHACPRCCLMDVFRGRVACPTEPSPVRANQQDTNTTHVNTFLVRLKPMRVTGLVLLALPSTRLTQNS